MPDWRQEVSRKVREYGEKKKILTTPPQPLKESSEEVAAEAGRAEEPPVITPLQAQRAKIITAALARVEPPEPPPAPVEPPPTRLAEPPVERIVPEATPPPPVRSYAPAAEAPGVSIPPVAPMERAPLYHDNEIMAGDLDPTVSLDDFEVEPEADADAQLLLGRRAGALLVDHFLLLLLHAGLLYICSEIMNLRFWNFLMEAWLPVTGIFLLFHCLYYLYFYKTSRQTPGMVFFSIELRDPLSGYIPASRILGRWLAFVFLNVFNFVPLFGGRKYLVLDAASGTQIRAFK